MLSSNRNIRFILKMAWRDSRGSRRKLLLFISSVALGVAALVAVETFSFNLQKDIDEQSKSLLGADFEVRSNQELADSTIAKFQETSLQSVKQFNFASMAFFPSTGKSRLADVRGVEKGFPFYGEVETNPSGQFSKLWDGKNAVVDKSILLQMGVVVGDSIQLGKVRFKVIASIEKGVGQSNMFAGVAPVVYFPFEFLSETGLLQKGSRVNYRYFFQVDEQVDVEQWLEAHDDFIKTANVRVTTVERRKKQVGRSFDDLNSFLSLVSFIALLLGGIGVGSAMYVYLKGKVSAVATLRCLGVKSREAYWIFLIQAAFMGLLGGVLGSILGVFIQQFFPVVFSQILFVEVGTELSWTAIAEGIGLGFFAALLFGAEPLLMILKISPLRALRVDWEEDSRTNIWGWLSRGILFGFIVLVAYRQTGSIQTALGFTVGLMVILIVLALSAYLLVWLVRRFFPDTAGYLLRQGLANLFRPNNQTWVLMTVMGLGISLISSLSFIQGMLLERVKLAASDNQPNMILFDIQPHQRSIITEVGNKWEAQIIQESPMVTMRLEKINGISKFKRDSTMKKIPDYVYNREYRVTYRDTLTSSEETREGIWQGKVNQGDSIFVSFSHDYMTSAGLDLGDELIFNVQGVRLKTYIGHTRDVNWQKMEANFVLLFPSGVLERYPQFFIDAVKLEDEVAKANFQREINESAPNISAIDIDLILSTLDELLGKVAFIIEFMGGFCIVTGFLVLIGAIVVGRQQRERESVLLRTLGASAKQVKTILFWEYAFISLFSMLSGTLLAILSSWSLAKFAFDAPFVLNMQTPLVVSLFVGVVTVLLGVGGSSKALNKTPMDVLRYA